MKLQKSETAQKQATLSLIRDYLQSGPKDAEQWKPILEASISDPTLFFAFQSTFPGHKAVKESFLIYDALETVTNGIHDQDILNSLSHVEESSPFFCWKNLIQGIAAIYSGDIALAQKFSDLIPSWSAVGSLKPFFAGFHPEKIRTLAAEPMFAHFFDDPSPLAGSYLKQLSEESEAGLWGEYAATALCFLKDFSGREYSWYRDFCVQVMSALSEEDEPFEDFLQGLIPIFSKAVSLVWACVSLLPVDPETGLIYLLQAMTLYCGDKNSQVLSRDLSELLESYSSLELTEIFFADEPELRVYALDLIKELERRIVLKDFPAYASIGLNRLKSFFRVPATDIFLSAAAEKRMDISAVQLELF